MGLWLDRGRECDNLHQAIEIQIIQYLCGTDSPVSVALNTPLDRPIDRALRGFFIRFCYPSVTRPPKWRLLVTNKPIYHSELQPILERSNRFCIGKKGTDFTPSIFVFDWKGNLTANYQLDKPVIAFTVSEELGKIYCTSLEEGNIIYEYNLPPLDNSNFAPQTTEHVETAYYTIELPETYATTSKQPDAITLFKGYYGNVNYFAPQRTQEGLTEGRFSGTVCIGLFEPSEKADPNATPFDHEDGTIGKSTFFVNDIETERLIQTTTVEENGNIQAIYHATYRFSIENTRIRLTVTHMRNDFEEPEQKQMIRHILESFQLKQHLNH